MFSFFYILSQDAVSTRVHTLLGKALNPASWGVFGYISVYFTFH